MIGFHTYKGSLLLRHILCCAAVISAHNTADLASPVEGSSWLLHIVKRSVFAALAH